MAEHLPAPASFACQRCTPRRRQSALVRALTALLVLTPQLGCESRNAVIQEVVRVPFSTITLPRLDGWMEDPTLAGGNAEDGGTVLRLVQRSAVLGSPRIDVLLEGKKPTPTQLTEYVHRNLQEMGALESAGRLRILKVEREDTTVDQVPAVRVQHEFTMGHGASQMSLFQVSLFLVYNGRGATVTASGRTELFHPQATAIAYLLQGVRIGTGSRQDAADAPTVDLGRVGGSEAQRVPAARSVD